jgi:hypothetical protein
MLMGSLASSNSTKMEWHHLSLEHLLLLVATKARGSPSPKGSVSLAVIPEPWLLLVPLLHNGAVLAKNLIGKLDPKLIAKVVPLLLVLVELVVKQRLHLKPLEDNPHLVFQSVLALGTGRRSATTLLSVGGKALWHGHGCGGDRGNRGAGRC